MVFDVFGVDRLQAFNIQVGEELTVHFDIDAHEYNGRWFTDIRAFRIERGQAAPAPAPGAEAAPIPETAPAASVAEPAPIPFEAPAATDELPF